MYIKINTKPSHIKSKTHKEIEVIFKINKTLFGQTCTCVNPEFDQVDCSVERAIDDCKQ